MTWGAASLVMFGGLVVAMGLGLPVAFAFLVVNVIGAILFLGGKPASFSSRATRWPRSPASRSHRSRFSC